MKKCTGRRKYWWFFVASTSDGWTLKSWVCINTFVNLKIEVVTEDKYNEIVYEIDCSNCEAVYFGESKWSLKSRSDEHKRSVRNCGCDKNEIAKHCWEADQNFNLDQKKVIDRESRLILRKIKKNHTFFEES